jgi:DNA-directed RNA polymerase I subunit RPA2
LANTGFTSLCAVCVFRDSLLAHGASFLLRDRLFNCSDKHVALVCRSCGSMLSTVYVKETALVSAGKAAGGGGDGRQHWKEYCRVCQSDSSVSSVLMPYVLRYLANELAAMGIRLTMEVSQQ